MSARITREQAREAAMKAFTAALDRMIPQDESKPLKGAKFRACVPVVRQPDRAVGKHKAVLHT